MSTVKRERINSIKAAIRSKYTSIGCYPLFLVTNDGAALCVDCGRSEWPLLIQSIHLNLKDGWDVAGADINWEDASLYCDHCNKRIESAYAEDEESMS